MHNASLLIDDIEDNSELRRGVPVAHKVFGIAQTINAANLVYFMALKDVISLHGSSEEREATLATFTEEMINLHIGQGQDILWRETHFCPTEEEYLSMVRNKTGGLFRLSSKLLQVFSPIGSNFSYGKTDLTHLLNLLGIYFQIRDDLLNLQDEEMFSHKMFCEDITEGKWSFPIIHCVTRSRQSSPPDHSLERILMQRTQDLNLKRLAVSLMESTSSFHFTVGMLNRIRDEVLQVVCELGGNKILEELMGKLHVAIDEVSQKLPAMNAH